MRIQSLALAFAVTVMSTLAVHAQDEKKAAPAPAPPGAKPGMTTKQKVSYSLGNDVGNSFKRAGLGAEDLDASVLAQAILDVLSNRKSVLSESELRASMTELNKIVRAKAEARAAVAAEPNIAEGLKFLAANKKKPGIKTTKSGMQYEVIRSGNGPTPKRTDRVTTHYKGQLISGKVFDGSYRGKNPTPEDKPISFDVDGVIDGWTEALLLMKVGDKWRLFLPSKLAYRNSGSGPLIGPGATLIFEIELISIP